MVTSRRGTKAATRFFRKLRKGLEYVPLAVRSPYDPKPHFRTRRHLLHAQEYRSEMANHFSIWNEVTGLTSAA